METKLTSQDCDLILESLRYTKEAFEAYKEYPSQEFKENRIAYVSEVIDKIKAIKKTAQIENN